MSTKLEAAARQALEALEQIATHVGQYDLPGMPNHITTLATTHRDALREALAEQAAEQRPQNCSTQQAAEPNAVLVEGFGRVALRKLNDLHEKGYAINGVSIATISEAGETNLGAVTTGGRVLWWPQQPAQQAAEPVAWTLTETLAKGQTTTRGFLWFSDPQNCLWTALYNHPAPTQQPLTDEQIDLMTRHTYHRGKPVDRDYRISLFRHAEAAYGITRSKT